MNAHQLVEALKRKTDEVTKRVVAQDGSVSPALDTGYRFKPSERKKK